jgi:hypothetical protein
MAMIFELMRDMLLRYTVNKLIQNPGWEREEGAEKGG